MARILCTGGAGFLGSVLVPMLLAEGHEVTVLDNFRYRENSLALSCLDPKLQIVCGDARDRDVLRPLLVKSDIIFPLAALVGAPVCDEDTRASGSTNFGAIHLLWQFTSLSQLIIFPTTNSGYGAAGGECNEDTPLNPISRYGRDKVDAENLLLNRGNVITLRLATVFGMSPRMRLDLLTNSFVMKAITDRAIVLFEPNFIRNFVHVRDVARVFIHALDNFDTMKDRPYNVACENLTKLKLCERIKLQVPDFQWAIAEHGEDPDKRNCGVDTTRIRQTGYETEISLDEGITELIKGCRTLRDRRYGNV